MCFHDRFELNCTTLWGGPTPVKPDVVGARRVPNILMVQNRYDAPAATSSATAGAQANASLALPQALRAIAIPGGRGDMSVAYRDAADAAPGHGQATTRRADQVIRSVAARGRQARRGDGC